MTLDYFWRSGAFCANFRVLTTYDYVYQVLVVFIAGAAAYARSRWRLPILKTLFGAELASLLMAALLARDPFHAMRLTAWLVFLHTPIWLCLCALQLRFATWGARAAAALAGVIALIAVDAFFIEPRLLEHTTFRVESRSVTRPLKIVVLSDLQTDEVGEYEQRVFDDIKRMAPDLLLLPGDFLQLGGPERAEQVVKLRQLFATVSPPLGAWAVQGNVDPDDYGEIFEGTSVRHFTNTTTIRVADGIELTALSLGDSFDSKFSPQPPLATGLHIVMGHAPDFALGSGSGELLIAGHTHGGQVQLPLIGPLLTLSAVPRPWAHGRTDLSEARTLVVSRGVGMERGLAPRLRFLCRPQLVVIEVVPTGSGERGSTFRDKFVGRRDENV